MWSTHIIEQFSLNITAGDNAENKMVSFNGGASQGGADYRYDGNGQRVKKVVGTVTTVFVYDELGQLIAEYSSVAPQTNGTRYVTSDHLGSPRVVTNSSGVVQARLDYHPFGEEVGLRGGRSAQNGYVADNLRQKFTQKERDIETGLDYFGARFYASLQGRFVSVDPLMSTGDADQPQSWNRYSYAHNSPLANIDVDGLYVWGEGATEERKEQFKIWLADVTRARDAYEENSEEYKRLDKIVRAYGEENTGTLSIRFDTKNSSQQEIGNATALARTSFFAQGNRVIAKQEVTFNTNKLDEVQVSTVAHEGQHIVDDKALAATLVIRRNKLVATNPRLNLTEFQSESRGIESGQLASAGLRRNDIRWAGTKAPSALYLNSWAETDKAALKASMSRARLNYLERWYGLTPEKQGGKTIQ